MAVSNVIIKNFNELSPDELYQVLRLRAAVFVLEQVCPYQDLDNADQDATHLWINQDQQPVAYVRVIQYSDGTASIGRVVTAPHARGEGFGKQIFEAGLTYCRANYSNKPIRISAQLYLKKFYEGFGFKQIGLSYLEDGIPHIKMMIEAHSRTH